MAKPATTASVQRDTDGPDYKGAIDLIRGPIRTNQSNTAKLGQDNSTLFQRVEKEKGVNREAAKAFNKIDAMKSEEKRTDFLRSLVGLVAAAGYGEFNDLVDQMQAGRPAPTQDEQERINQEQREADSAAFEGEGGSPPDPQTTGGNVKPFPGRPN